MKQKIIQGLKYIGIFCIYFLIQYQFINAGWFATDELDVMTGGKAIASGYQLYGDFLSQHMPFTYYLSAVFDALGATSVVLQRIAFDLFYAFMWTVIYARYQKTVNKNALLLYPICFSGLITCYEMGTVVLSEHLAGIGFVILFLEFLGFYKSRELKVSNYIAISVAVLLTFGTIFIAIFGVFVIAVGVLAREIQWNIQEKRKFSDFFKDMLRKYVPLVCWVVLPWAVLAVYYSIKDNLKLAFYSAYTVNREIYSEYTDYGASISKTMLGGMDAFCDMVKGFFSMGGFYYVTAVQLLAVLAIIIFVYKIFKKKEYLLGIVLICYLLEMGVRGYFSYHGTQWVAVAALIMSIVFCDILVVSKEKFLKRSSCYRAMVMACALLIMVCALGNISNIADAKFTIEDNDEKLGELEKKTRDIIEIITEEDEAIWQLSFANYVSMTTDRPAIENVGATPWMWDALGIRALTLFEEESPRVALYNEAHGCWDYALTDYAPELVAYMHAHYTNYEGTEIYIRNDYYDEACSMIQEGN